MTPLPLFMLILAQQGSALASDECIDKHTCIRTCAKYARPARLSRRWDRMNWTLNKHGTILLLC